MQFSFAAIVGALALVTISSFMVGNEPVALLSALAAFFIACVLAVMLLKRGYPHTGIGLCNLVTLGRLVLVCALLATVYSPGPVGAVVMLASLALLLDGLDGWLARRQGHESEFGARFDMEVDAALGLVLALSVLTAGTLGSLGPAVLLLGLPRYAFAVAAWRWRWIDSALPARFGRKVVCVLQIIALIALQLPTLTGLPAMIIFLAALGALGWSFGRDLRWLWQNQS